MWMKRQANSQHSFTKDKKHCTIWKLFYIYFTCKYSQTHDKEKCPIYQWEIKDFYRL